MKAFSYIRFSTPEQSKGDSERRQDDAAEKWCKQNGAILDRSLILRDRGVSGFKGKNAVTGDLGKFLKAIKDGRVDAGDVLLVEKFDRLSRMEVMAAFDQFREIIDAGVDVVTLMDGKRHNKKRLNDAPYDLMGVLMQMAQAHDFSATLSKRVGSAWAKKRANAKTKPVSAKCPGWIELDKGTQTFRILPAKAAVIRRIVKLAIEGQGPVAISKILNRTKTPTFTKRTNKPSVQWEFSTLQYLLRSKTLLGEYQPKKMVDGKATVDGAALKDYYPAVIAEDEFYKLQAILDSRATNVKGRGAKNVSNLFGRLLKSAQDGGTMVLSHKRVGSIEMVSANYTRGTAPCRSFPYLDFEAAFLQWVGEIELTDSVAASRVQEIEGRLSEIRHKIKRIQDKMDEDGQFDALLDQLAKFGAQEKLLAADLESERARNYQPAPVNAQREINAIVERLAKLDGEALQEARSRLRSQIAQVCQSIRVSIHYKDKALIRMAVATVGFADGTSRVLSIHKRRGEAAKSIRTDVLPAFKAKLVAGAVGKSLAKV